MVDFISQEDARQLKSKYNGCGAEKNNRIGGFRGEDNSDVTSRADKNRPRILFLRQDILPPIGLGCLQRHGLAEHCCISSNYMLSKTNIDHAVWTSANNKYCWYDLIEFILGYNIEIFNVGTVHIFVVRNRSLIEEIIHLSVLRVQHKGGGVSINPQQFNHRIIQFSLENIIIKLSLEELP